MEGEKALCICASHMKNSDSIGRRICEVIAGNFRKKEICAEIVDLQEISMDPCGGCGGCREGLLCVADDNFNQVYGKMTDADYLFFISPHHAPVPSKLCMLLEKVVQLTLSGGQQAISCQPVLGGKLAGIISYGEGDEQKLMHYKAMVNDIIADALAEARMKVIPFNSKWNTGIAISVAEDPQKQKSISGKNKETFPEQENSWWQIEKKVEMYVEIVVQTSRTLYAIL